MDKGKWLWQGVATNLISAGVIAVLGIALGIIKVKWPSVGNPALYAVVSMALLSVIYFAFTGRGVLSREAPKTTPKNVETNIRTWLDAFGLSVKKESDPLFIFLYTITLRNDTPIAVGRPKDTDHYLVFRADLSLSPEHVTMVNQLDQEHSAMMIRELNLELARAKIGYALIGPPLKLIRMVKQVPITSTLNEHVFATLLNEMDSTVSLAREATVLAIAHNAMHHEGSQI
jgi:hypothetical protein